MRTVKMLSFHELVKENKEELMKNDEEMERIEKRIDEKRARLAKVKTRTGA